MENQKSILELEIKANTVRQLLMPMLVAAGSGHTAGPLDMADIFTAFYFHLLSHNPKDPNWEDRDRLILSNGHICPVRYAAMALAGYFPLEELQTLRKINSRLQGHPHRTSLPGLETTSGPLGEGLSQSLGIALTAQMDKKDYYVYCLTSDGEHQEGNTWEAAMAAGKYKVSHLIEIVDFNNIQIDGPVDSVMPLEPFRAKYESFNWEVLEMDGNNMQEVLVTIQKAKTITDKPVCIIAHTMSGKGVSFMENDYKWHGKPPTQEEAEKALVELKKTGEELEIKLSQIL
ncbi:MAG: transketolase [Candidatus Levyibacteriota bacterium]